MGGHGAPRDSRLARGRSDGVTAARLSLVLAALYVAGGNTTNVTVSRRNDK